MVIKASSHTQIDALIRDLTSSGEVTRDAAIARLTVIGARAIDRLARLARDASARATGRQAALRALEAIGDPRATDAALQATDDADDGVAAAAIAAAAALLQTRRSADVVDRLTSLALDRARPRSTRAAAIRALGGLRAKTVAPLLDALGNDPDGEIAALASGLTAPSGAERRDPAEWLARTVEGALPADPARIRRALSQSGRTLSLAILHRLVQRIREREAAEPASRRADWTTTRAEAHVALAQRGSRIALYDLRETLETATDPLPVEFLTALADGGDATCLEAIAAAYAKARAKRGADGWRHTLADTFRAIVERETITKRNAVMKKIGKRWPQALAGLGLKP